MGCTRSAFERPVMRQRQFVPGNSLERHVKLRPAPVWRFRAYLDLVRPF